MCAVSRGPDTDDKRTPCALNHQMLDGRALGIRDDRAVLVPSTFMTGRRLRALD